MYYAEAAADGQLAAPFSLRWLRQLVTPQAMTLRQLSAEAIRFIISLAFIISFHFIISFSAISSITSWIETLAIAINIYYCDIFRH